MNTTYFLNLVAGNIFGTKKSPAIPSKFYLGLSTSAPNVSGGGVTEPTDSAYARMELSSLGAPTGGVVSNTSIIEFPESATDWGIVSYYCIYDAATGGNLLMYGQLEKSRTVEANTVMIVRAGSLNLSMVNPA